MQDFFRRLSDVISLSRLRSRWKKISVILAVLVLIVTVYFLTVPAVTMEGDLICGLDEHTHVEACFSEVRTAVCGYAESEAPATSNEEAASEESETTSHIHNDDCYEVSSALLCTYIEHTHSESCLYVYEEPTEAETTEPETTLSEEEELENVIVMLGASKAQITYSSELADFIDGFQIVDKKGETITNGSVVYIGEVYQIYISFAEDNLNWNQFAYNKNGYLTYHLPASLKCVPFTDWHKITTTDPNTGITSEVGEYFVDADGLLSVRFYEVTDSEGKKVNYIDKYPNVNLTVNLEASVASTQSGSSTVVDFGNELKVEIEVDGGADFELDKEMIDYDIDNHHIEYEIKVVATHGVVKNFVIDDTLGDTGHNHSVIMDSIVVTDLKGNVINPQPVVTPDNANTGGFHLTGFPDFVAGDGYLIRYKTAVDEDVIVNYQGQEIYVYNYALGNGNGANGATITKNDNVTEYLELEKLLKTGKHMVIKDKNGNNIDVIRWTVRIGAGLEELGGNVVIDSLGEGLNYYTDEKLHIKMLDGDGFVLDAVYYEWGTDVRITGDGSIEFNLPPGSEYEVIYYTVFDKNFGTEFHNNIKTTLNGKEVETQGSGNIVEIVPEVFKNASGEDGEYVYYDISTEVSSILHNQGNFFFSDTLSFWDGSEIYVQNIPENLKITAVTDSGKVVEFTPYVEGGPVENTYILETPIVHDWGGVEHYVFNVYFNTSIKNSLLSTWLLDEDAVLMISYKIPFDASVVNGWGGQLDPNRTLGDLLNEGKNVTNYVYFSYSEKINAETNVGYGYQEKVESPILDKEGKVNEDGTIDYTLVFNNTVEGTTADGYLGWGVDNGCFTDTFDPRLEYVPDSLIVSCYDPWNKYFWVNKYIYRGEVTGNVISAPTSQFELLEYNAAEADPYYGHLGVKNSPTLEDYYQNNIPAGKYIFTYKLRVKDEYKNTVNESKFYFDNTAEITWGNNGSSGPATETVEYETGLIDKKYAQQNDVASFEISINENALNILPDADTITVTDSMSKNLSIFWDTIKLEYEKPNNSGIWIDFADVNSEYSYNVTYDSDDNMLTFELPDSLHIKIKYSTLITQSGNVSISNTVKIDGKAHITDIIDAEFFVEEHSGDVTAWNHTMTLLKQDGLTSEPLEDATFALYGDVPTDAVPPEGVDLYITVDDEVFYYIGTYTTGEDGTKKIESQFLTEGKKYALVEVSPPEGYALLTSPVLFYFYEKDPDGVIQTVTTIITIQNFTGGYILPETGGMGVYYFYLLSGALLTTASVGLIVKKKRYKEKT